MKIIILLILLYLKIKNKPSQSGSIPKIDGDIVISPGGRYGMYNLGICHYIKNHFNIKNKKIVGFSAGAWNALFMTIKHKNMNEILRKIFKMNKDKLSNMLKKTKNIVDEYSIDDFDIKNLYIGTTTCNIFKNDLVIHNNFLTIEDLTRCCVSSSFIPFLTYNDLFYFYKNKLSFDGGLLYKKYIKTLPPTTLIISFKMFGRHTNQKIYKELYKKNKISVYQLYIKGYHDAKKNHDYFKNFLYSS